MVYRTSIVTFIDVLGFGDLVIGDPTGAKVLEVVSKLRAFGTEDLFDRQAAQGARAMHFSDSVVRFTPLIAEGDGPADRDAILQEIEDLTYIQGELSALSIFIRGGIAVGLAYADRGGVFGPALIDAYTLESRHALYPRIILHPTLAARWSTDGGRGWSVHAHDGLPLTRSSEDGFHFIDYLRNFPREVHSDKSPEREEIACSYMTPRKEHIERELLTATTLGTVATKYRWLARYHNEVAREVLGRAASDLVIAT